MHWPVAFANPKNSELASLKSQDGRPIENHILSQDIAKTWANMEEMVKKGKVRNIGISNFNIRRVDQLLQEAEINPAVNQVEVNWSVANDELLHYCEAHQVKLQAYSPLGSSDYVNEYLSDPIILDVAERNGITPAQAVLAWHIARGIIPITRSRQADRLEEALAAAHIELPWPDVQHLTKQAGQRPIQRVVDPTTAWNVKEDIFEDGVDQTRLMSLKTESLEVPLPHEGDSSHYLEPRNHPEADLKPTESVARFHSFAGSRTKGTKGSTVVQQLMQRRAFSSTRATAAASPAASSAPSFLASTSKQSLATPGLKWTDGQVNDARETRKMNMCTVRGPGGQARFASSVAASASASASSSAPAVFKAPSKRVFQPRKAFLHSQYTRLLAQSQFMLVFQHNNLTVEEWSKLRQELHAVPLPQGAEDGERAKITVVRAGIMKPVLRDAVRNQGKKQLRGMENVLSGPLAMLTSSSLNPKYVEALLSVTDKALGNRAFPTAAAPGQQHVKTAKVNPRLVPLLAVVEGNQFVDVPSLRDISKLPDLQTLRAQIVGLLSAPAGQLANVLSMASGAQLALLLEARKRQLDEQAGGQES